MESDWAFIPRTGQAACFDEEGREVLCLGAGQDGESRPGESWPEPRFMLREPGIVFDAMTGLEWPRDTSAAFWPMTHAEAEQWIQSANRDRLLGLDGWRLPSRRELLYLVCPDQARPCLPFGHPFQNVFQHWHWASTISAAAPNHAWRVHLEGGRMFPGPVTAAHMVLPVRGEGRSLPESSDQVRALGRDWPVPRIEVSGDEALDRLTGLVWLARPITDDAPCSWQEALEAARNLGEGWRLPSIYELESLVDASRAWPALPQDHPFGGEFDGVWSATTSGYDRSWAWVLYFGKGAVGVGHKPGRHFKFLLTRDS